MAVDSAKAPFLGEPSKKRPRFHGGYSGSSYSGGGQSSRPYQSAPSRSIQSVLQASSGGPSRPSGYGAGQSYGSSYSRLVNCGSPSTSSASVHRSPVSRSCYTCGDPGHFMRDYPRPI
ncbi:uncharacterized protein LOC132041834 [Lycium ferocissimum]|uniref:uncharacterized protein LOC132041834 n=1 Tax=Lycium ferocissimum TaxID=112874 RepID=UPI0028162DC2|nr:uncharacterized protein LOC132041834 [Lycium ferocissimum]